jgi:hypothetical protein
LFEHGAQQRPTHAELVRLSLRVRWLFGWAAYTAARSAVGVKNLCSQARLGMGVHGTMT